MTSKNLTAPAALWIALRDFNKWLSDYSARWHPSVSLTGLAWLSCNPAATLLFHQTLSTTSFGLTARQPEPSGTNARRPVRSRHSLEARPRAIADHTETFSVAMKVGHDVPHHQFLWSAALWSARQCSACSRAPPVALFMGRLTSKYHYDSLRRQPCFHQSRPLNHQ